MNLIIFSSYYLQKLFQNVLLLKQMKFGQVTISLIFFLNLELERRLKSFF